MKSTPRSGIVDYQRNAEQVRAAQRDSGLDVWKTSTDPYKEQTGRSSDAARSSSSSRGCLARSHDHFPQSCRKVAVSRKRKISRTTPTLLTSIWQTLSSSHVHMGGHAHRSTYLMPHPRLQSCLHQGLGNILWGLQYVNLRPKIWIPREITTVCKY